MGNFPDTKTHAKRRTSKCLRDFPVIPDFSLNLGRPSVQKYSNKYLRRLPRCEYSQYFPPFSETVQNLGVNSYVWTMLETQHKGMTPRVQNRQQFGSDVAN